MQVLLMHGPNGERSSVRSRRSGTTADTGYGGVEGECVVEGHGRGLGEDLDVRVGARLVEQRLRRPQLVEHGRIANPREPQGCRILLGPEVEQNLQRLKLVLHQHRDLADGQALRGERVHVRGVEIDVREQRARHDVGVAESDRIAVRPFGQPPHVDGANPRRGHAGLLPDDVGVHARTAHVLADFVDDESVEIFEGKPRQKRIGPFEQPTFRLDERVVAPDRHSLDRGRLLERVLHERDGADQPRTGRIDDDAGPFEHEPAHAQAPTLVVNLRCARLFPHADHEHLADAALEPVR